ncbi:uncharacterized protein LOC119074310 isoform X1 [Bradysia coprophila]|uniref:uncharacterized protein LOC119074310 isoform X1 n=1 Tax=Bradysia coprophila TaxID=38358 RepID=UPI00187DB7A1|nr:uncharacterized protein LOC119074310 isoform X1 [Bradysia coprophila]
MPRESITKTMHQQNIYQQQQPQFPNFTHPPPSIEFSLPHIDDATIERFLIDRNHLAIQVGEPNVYNHFKINGRDRLTVIQMNLTNLIRQQQMDETNLKNNIAHLAPAPWEDKVNSIKQNQIKIAKLLTKFEALSSSEVAKTTVVKRRKNKRKMRKARSTKQELTNNTVEEAAATKRPKFEDDLEQSYEKYEMERIRTANLKRSNECKRQLAMLESLVELRCIRRKNSNVTGSGHTSSEKCFIEQIDQLKSKWNEALEKCNSLENKLKMLLTSTASQLWLNALFSNTEAPFVDNTADVKALLDIRKSWDLCLVTNANVFGSSIPPGWVLPNPTPSNEWVPFLVK